MGIMSDLANGVSVTDAVQREALLYAVQREITCPYSGVILDIRTAVLVEGTYADGRAAGTHVLDGARYDTIAESLASGAADKDLTLVITDGRVINAPKSRARKARA